MLYPIANVAMQVDGLEIEVEAAILERLPVAVLLGKEVPELTQLLGKEEANRVEQEQQGEAMVVVTHAQAQRNLEEELLRKEKEVLAGAKSSSLGDGTGELEAQTDGAEPAVKATPLTQDQRRSAVSGRSGTGGGIWSP